MSDARAAVAELASRAGAPRSTVDCVRLAVSEAVSNAVVHGFRNRMPGHVTLRAEIDGPGLTVSVRDDGCGMSPRADSPGAGLGLPLIAEVAESVTFSPGEGGRGTVLRMTFELPVVAAA